MGFQGKITVKRGQVAKGTRLPTNKLNYLRNMARKTWHMSEQHLEIWSCQHGGPAFPLSYAL